MRAPHRIVQLTVAAVVFVLGGVAAPAHADGYIENGTDNPVAARPAPTRPATKHCTVTLADHFLSNGPDGAPRNFQGTVAPPAACPGPWAKVLMDYDVSVSGRQFDRSASITIGGAAVYVGTTQEPSGPVPISYRVTKDVTRYEAAMLSYLRSDHKDVLKTIRDTKALDDDTAKKLKDALTAFGKQFA